MEQRSLGVGSRCVEGNEHVLRLLYRQAVGLVVTHGGSGVSQPHVPFPAPLLTLRVILDTLVNSSEPPHFSCL